MGMKLVTPEQMNAIDASAINDFGIPGMLLMENAAAAVVAEAVSMLGGCSGKYIVLLAGRGNNGGDALAAARLLHCRGADVFIGLVGPKAGIGGDALANLKILENIGLPVVEILDENELGLLHTAINRAQLIIDGLFGTGLRRDVEAIARKVIEQANASKLPILSIDIPSGIDGTDGKVKGNCIKADVTVTFCMPKTGLALHPGCDYSGRLVVADIGIPPAALEKQDIRTELIDAGMVSRMLPRRVRESNKGDYGRVLLVSGSTGMTGSGCLASMAALRSGAGLVYAGVPGSLAGIYGTALTEPIILPLEDAGSGRLTDGSAGQILEYLKRMDVAVIGPGLTASGDIPGIMGKVIAGCAIPLILDADALNAVSINPAVLKSLRTRALVTPHPGEMARLTGLSVDEVQSDRTGVAKRFAAEYGVTVVLKGSRTVIARPDGRVYINPTGNAGMATAGTGDVLAGMLAGLAAQGMDLDDAAVAGVYLHGLAGDAAAFETGMHGMLAGDVIRHLPQVMKDMLSEV